MSLSIEEHKFRVPEKCKDVSQNLRNCGLKISDGANSTYYVESDQTTGLKTDFPKREMNDNCAKAESDDAVELHEFEESTESKTSGGPECAMTIKHAQNDLQKHLYDDVKYLSNDRLEEIYKLCATTHKGKSQELENAIQTEVQDDVDDQYDNEIETLCYAIAEGNKEIVNVKLLLGNEIDVTGKNSRDIFP